MTICHAVFENGAFRPLTPLDILAEGQIVRLVVEPVQESPEGVLDVVMHIYDGLSEEQVDEIEHIILNRDHFFKGREPL